MATNISTFKSAMPHPGKVAGRFRHAADVRRAMEAAEQIGYHRGDIEVVHKRSEANPADAVPADKVRGDKPMEGPWMGAMLGALIGAATGAMAGLWLPPAIGLTVRPLWAAVLLGGLLALVGFYLGSLVGVGMPEGREKEFQEAVEEGEVLLSVDARTEADATRIKNAWAQLGAEDVAA